MCQHNLKYNSKISYSDVENTLAKDYSILLSLEACRIFSTFLKSKFNYILNFIFEDHYYQRIIYKYIKL